MKYVALFMGCVGFVGAYAVHTPVAQAAGCGCQATYNSCMKSGNAAMCQQTKAMCVSMCKDKGKTKRDLSKAASSSSTVNVGKGINLGNKAKAKSAKMDYKVMCDDESKTLSGDKIRSKNIAIIASGNCKLTLKKVKVSAKTGIYVQGNATITLVNSSIKGKKAGLVVDGNATVYLVGKSSIKGKKSIVLNDGANASVFLSKKSKLKGKKSVASSANINVTKKYKGEGVQGANAKPAAKTGGIIIE